jgi:hypothetical protein
MASKRARSFTSPIKAACSGLIALLLLSLLCLVQSDVTTSTAATSGGAGVSMVRQGDVAALLSITGKTQGLEIRTGRPVPTKFVSGNPGVLPSEAAFLLVDQVSWVQAAALSATLHAPQASTNQPRAPPSA